MAPVASWEGAYAGQLLAEWRLTMQDELAELLEIAIYKEIASEALYRGAQKNTSDSGARALMMSI